MRGLWFSSQYRRLCDLSPEGKPGAARLNFVSATSVLGVLGAVVGAVLAVAKNSDPARIYGGGWGNLQLRSVRSESWIFLCSDRLATRYASSQTRPFPTTSERICPNASSPTGLASGRADSRIRIPGRPARSIGGSAPSWDARVGFAKGRGTA